MADRLHCIAPGCRRTAPAEKYPPNYEIICSRCWKKVPLPLKAKYARLKRHRRRLEHKSVKTGIPYQTQKIDRFQEVNWQVIREFITRTSEEPGGLDEFIRELGF